MQSGSTTGDMASHGRRFDKGRRADVDPPLCVDLDGTLVRTDLLHEAVFRYLKSSPFALFQMISVAARRPGQS